MTIVIKLLKQLTVVKWQFLLGIMLLGVVSASTQMAPLIIQWSIDTLLVPVSTGASLHLSRLLSALGLYVGIVMLTNILFYLTTRLLMYCANKVGESLRNQAYDVMQSLPISYFDDKPAGKISTRIVNDTETLRSQYYGTLLSNVLVNVSLIIFIYIVSFSLNIWLGFFLLMILPIFYIWQRLYGKITSKQLQIFYESQSHLNSQVNETMNGSTIIQMFNQQNKVSHEFDETAKCMLKTEHQLINVEATISWGLSNVFKRLFIAIILAFIGYHYLGSMGISVGLLFSYIHYTERLFDSLGMLVRLFPNLQRALTTGKRILELLEEQTEVDSHQELIVTNGEVVFDNITFSYIDNHPVLKNISFRAQKGQTIALVGHTGSGKSSIMNLLFRFYDAQKGVIYIDGQNIQACRRESVRSDMGIVLQDPYLFTGTIASNVAMDNNDMDDDSILDALKKVGAKDMLSKFEKGIHHPIVEKGKAFSSGERQLIAFARTLASNPKILILDEATSHIDTETEAIIQYAMNVVKEGRTTFIIAHRLSTIQDADQILVLHEGEIVERGTHDELIVANGQYAEMYRMQQTI